jgi:uncharacterized membrane protein
LRVVAGTVAAMGTGLSGGLYRLLLLLHILCAMIGFGTVSFTGMRRARARQRATDGKRVLLEEDFYVNRNAEFLMYGVLVFGILVALTSKSTWKFDQSWLSVAILLYIVDIGILHGVIHRSERVYKALLEQVNGGAVAGPGAGVSELEQLERRISLAWGGFNAILLVILYLMVFTPGQVRVG